MAFMRPSADYFTEEELLDILPPDDTNPDGYCAGWYSRLSASGYLDCTEWNGPYPSEREALAGVMGLYEVDENGNELNESEHNQKDTPCGNSSTDFRRRVSRMRFNSLPDGRHFHAVGYRALEFADANAYIRENS